MNRELLASLLTALLVIALIVVWAVTERAEQEHAAQETSIIAGQAALRLQDYVRARILAAETLRTSFESGGAIDEAAFRALSRDIQGEFGGFLALSWIDADGIIQWAVPLERNQAAQGKSPRGHPLAQSTFARAERDRADVATQPLTLFQGVQGFATYLPMDPPSLGYVNGVFDIGALVEQCFTSGLMEHWDVVVKDADTSLFTTPGFEDNKQPASTASLAVLDRTWTLTVRRRGPATSITPLARRGVLAFGLILAVALGVAVRAVRERTREREEADTARVELARELAESRRLEALGQLAGGVAHDVNNLLTTISGAASLLRDGRDDPELLGLTDDILVACRSGADLTGGLLAYSRLQLVQPRVLDTNVELARAGALLARIVREDIHWERDVAEGLWPVEMDPGEFSRVVINLVGNAVDAMPKGGVLALEAANAPGAGETPDGVVITVSDSGEGISEEVKLRIFEPFFTTKAPGRGTGLGLASVQGAVAAAHGTITVESAPGAGARFTVWLPRSHEEPASRSSIPAIQAISSRRTVLLVEDQEAVRRVATKILERAGHEVLVAEHAVEARRIFDERADIDILVTDVVMPGVNGAELAAALRRARPDLAVVFTSGYAREQLAPEMLQHERCVYLQKPFGRTDLTAAITRLVG